jgi:lantibiotic transport system permease protein
VCTARLARGFVFALDKLDFLARAFFPFPFSLFFFQGVLMWLNTFKAEFLKYKRTSALFLAVGIPLAINGLFLLAYLINGSQDNATAAQNWKLFLSNLHGSWITLFLPVGLGILASLVLGLEHADNQWKQQLILGATRIQVYIGKWLAVLGLVLFGSVVLMLGSFLVGGIITGFQQIPLTQIYQAPVLALLGSVAIISLQTWLALRFRAVGVGLGVALFGAIAGDFAGQSQRWWYFVPWSFPNSMLADERLTTALLLSLGVGLILLILGALDCEKRDMI